MLNPSTADGEADDATIRTCVAFAQNLGYGARVGRLRAYGNAIVPQAAAEFVRSFLDVKGQEIAR
jgi:hypothetical protein